MNCPTCGGDCVRPAEEVLDELFQMYMACGSCPSDLLFNKNAPFHEKIDSNTGRCTKCGRRHLDFVIGNVLMILKEKGLFPADAALKDVAPRLSLLVTRCRTLRASGIKVLSSLWIRSLKNLLIRY